MERGKMIAIYGINGIGKTTQVELLVKYLKSLGINANRQKYPVYDLEPEGPFINNYLRNEAFRTNNPKTTHELQYIYMNNRLSYESTLQDRLTSGEWIIAEDYTGTGVAWGLAWGGDLNYLEKINKNLLLENLSILIDGERFLTAVETTHRNEMDVERLNLCKNFLRLLASRYNWTKVNANNKVLEVQKNIKLAVSNLI